MPEHIIKRDGRMVAYEEPKIAAAIFSAFKAAESAKGSEEAARLAAYYSQNKTADKVEIDYVEKKHVKKVAGAKPGFVIYHTNYSMVIDTDISGIQKL